MKQRLLMLLSFFIAIASVGWVQAANTGPTISSDLVVARWGIPVVAAVTTEKGNVAEGTKVRVKLESKSSLANWKLRYYEPNGNAQGWKDWTPDADGSYWFGPSTGFPLADATSYIEVTAGKDAENIGFTLKVINISDEAVVATADQKLTVGSDRNYLDQSLSTITDGGTETDYAGLHSAVRFAKANGTISLAAGGYAITRSLIIDKPLTIVGDNESRESVIQPLMKDGKIWKTPAGQENNNAYKHLVLIVGGNADETVTLKNITLSQAVASGMNVQSAMKTVLTNVGLEANEHAGLLALSEVNATGLHTKANIWGGVNVDKGTPAYTPSFTFDATSTFEEFNKVWSEITNDDNVVKAPANKGWESYVYTDTDSKRYWTTNEKEVKVKDTKELKLAIFSAIDGQTIQLTGNTYGEAAQSQLFGTIAKKNVTITKPDSIINPPKVYGTIKIAAEGCTVKGLHFFTQGAHPTRNALYVLGKTVTIQYNKFEVLPSVDGKLNNGVCIYPYGEGEAKYVVSKNQFNGFKNPESGDQSTGMIIAEGLPVKDYFGDDIWNDAKTVEVTVDDFGFMTGNSFDDCYCNYVHSLWSDAKVESMKFCGPLSGSDALNEAFTHVAPRGTIIAFQWTAEEVAGILNTIGKKPDLAGMTASIKVSDGTIVTNKDMTTSNTKWVLTEEDGKYKVTRAQGEPVVDFAKVTASDIEAGQSLSASSLTVGKDASDVPGTFAWKTPGTIVGAGDHPYPVVFTPSDPAQYRAIEGYVTIENIIQYYTATVQKSANGKVSFKDVPERQTKFAARTALTLDIVPDANYEFTHYVYNGKVIPIGDGKIDVSKDFTISGLFTPIMHKVTVQGNENGGDVLINGGPLSNQGLYPQGSALTIQAVPYEGMVLTGLAVDGKPLQSNTVTLTAPMTITATFAPKPAATYTVAAPAALTNGKIVMYDATKNILLSGSAVKEGTTVSVVAVPDMGCEEDAKLTVEGATLKDGVFTVGKADVAVKASFKKISYVVTPIVFVAGVVATDVATIELTPAGTTSSASPYPFGTELTATVKITDSGKHKLLSLVVNGKEIQSGDKFVVSNTTTVRANVVALKEVVINDAVQSYTYSVDVMGGRPEAKPFAIKPTPADLTGFKVEYSTDNTTWVADAPFAIANHEAKEYSVKITREAKDGYAKYEKTIENGLTITPGQLRGVAAPTMKSDSELTGTDNKYAVTTSGSDANGHIATVTYTPEDETYAKIVFSVNAPGATEIKVTNELTTRAAGGAAATITVTGEGSVKIMNGGSEASNCYVGQTVRLLAVPAVGYAAVATWKVGSEAEKSGSFIDVTLVNGMSIGVTFKKKEYVTVPTQKSSSETYSGGTFAISDILGETAGWSIFVEQDGKKGVAPVNAGTYNVKAVCAGDENTNSAEANYSFDIEPAASGAVIVGNASGILKGQTLASSVITGTAVTDGAFKWMDDTKVPTLNDQTDYPAYFQPSSSNYAPTRALKAKVKVTDVNTRIVTLAVTGQDVSKVKMTLDGKGISGGVAVAKGQKLKVDAEGLTGWSVSIKVNGAAYTNGSEYTVGESGDVAVVVTYTKNSPTPPTPPVGVETVIGDSRVYGGMSQLVVEPAMPLHVTIVNMAGNVFYNDKMVATTSVSVQAGVYVVTLSDGKEAMTKKVIVR